MSAAQPFNPKVVFGLIATGVIAFGALMLLLAYGGGMGGGNGGQGHALSRAATGFHGLVTLVGELRESHLDESSDEWADHLLVVTLEERNTPEQVSDLLTRRAGYPTLIILPKWITMNDPERRGWVRSIGPGAGAMAGPLLGKDVNVSLADGRLPGSVAGMEEIDGIHVPLPQSPQQVRGGNLVPIASLPGGGALIARIGDQPHYVAADPDLFNNHGLRDPARARAAFEMIDRMNEGGEFVDFDVTMNGYGAGNAPSMLRLAFEPPFLAMTLALVIAALLAGFHGAFRFGPVRRAVRAIAFGKAALVENAAGLIKLARREARLGAAYADVVRGEVARLSAAPAWLQGEALDAYLDRLGKPGGAKFTELAANLHNARDRGGLMAAARALSQWKKDIIA